MERLRDSLLRLPRLRLAVLPVPVQAQGSARAASQAEEWRWGSPALEHRPAVWPQVPRPGLALQAAELGWESAPPGSPQEQQAVSRRSVAL